MKKIEGGVEYTAAEYDNLDRPTSAQEALEKLFQAQRQSSLRLQTQKDPAEELLPGWGIPMDEWPG